MSSITVSLKGHRQMLYVSKPYHKKRYEPRLHDRGTGAAQEAETGTTSRGVGIKHRVIQYIHMYSAVKI